METFSITGNSSSFIILTRPSTRHKPIFLPQRHTFNPIRCTNTDNNNNSSSSSSSNTTNDDANSVQVQAPTTTPTTPVEISFRRRSRRQAKRLRENENSGMQKARVETPPKKWEDMSLSEKAVELYVGEKGALFWLNKFAYASIFIMIGGWIAFRFVGPAFNLYQLDGPLLSPSDVFK
ncbi:hypothetical protein GLYMA_02G048800v4 [Glycine max]|uniref:Uncharacterized protein n=2 Tax=Glycine subgen. Soja TaxID=1462606 RepID=I1JCI0_SOYBN|nr:uncharacterized protein LOC100782207 [Glycine max]XP_028196649.1 uncharacterized protein LOC114381578 [Glycine soja]KAG5050852.1 hypothetical protein JHK87_003050 [Glycine soja]KAG5079145.1 hypothetical protein JHK86_003210 [Glycine max]KAH1058772.1 hypothetical protein GYH30_003039 [Glycine max]KAH1260258.1 hypothetical protein GmHk_02G003428 [Glycine max]KHN00482.1 hypothetical protein glysoja_000150 [Glycine soja]|eukprot:XP_003520258.1 uncharacterized protein LOC100782207 [Glycine max]